MRTANTNKTSEGAEEAARWLATNSHLLPALRAILAQYYRDSGRDFPWRQTADPYKLLVAEVLLQKTGSRPVGDIWRAFVERYPDIRSLAAASLDELEQILRPLGLRKRALILYDAAHTLLQQ